MFKFKILLVFFLFISLRSWASVNTDFFRSLTSGNYTSISTWQSSNNNIDWFPSTLVPSTSSRGVFIRSGHNVIAVSTVIVDDFFVLEGGIFTINRGVQVTITNGAASVDASISGLLKNQGRFFVNGIMNVLSTGIYQHNDITLNHSLPTITWLDGSTCEFVDYTTFNSTILNANQNYYNLVWNCPTQIIGSNPNLDFQTATIRNNFSILGTGTGSLTLSGRSFNLNILNYNQVNGNVIINPINNNLLSSNINISGDFNMQGGTLFKGIGSSLGNIIFNGVTLQNYIKTGGTLSQAINFIVNPGAILNFGSNIINGNTGRFTASAGSTIITSNIAGFALTGATGSVQSTGVRSYNTAANYTYNGTSQQQTGNGLPITVNNVTVDNAAGVILRTGDLNINGELAINNGFLDVGTNALVSNGPLGMVGNGELITQNISSTPLTANKTWQGTVSYNSSAAQTIVSGSYNNLNGTGGGRTLNTIINIAGVFTPGTPSLYTIANSTVNFNGGALQNIPAFSFDNLSFSNGTSKNLAGAVSVLSTLLVNTPSVLNTNGNLTMITTANKNANIGPLLGSADIIGDVNVQSYLYGVPSGAIRGTKTMSSPVNDALISGNKTFRQLQNFLIITGPGGTANGFDAGTTVPFAVTLNFYREDLGPTVSSFTPVPNINTPTSPGTGFLYFHRGDRTNIYGNPGKLTAPFPPAEDVAITYRGPINKKDINVNIVYTNNSDSFDGFYLAGNPYPSTIDWEAIQPDATNINTSITIVTGGKANSSYNTIGDVSANGGSRYIQPGQGFYIQAGSGGGTLRFRESHKNTIENPARLLSIPEQNTGLQLASSTGNQIMVGSTPASANQNNIIRVQLSTTQFKEEAVILFNQNYSATADGNDTKYFTGYSINMNSLSADGKPLAINLMPDVSAIESVKLNVNGFVSSNMKLEFTELRIDAGAEVKLKDNYLNILTPLSLGTIYNFNIDKAIAESFGANRFELVFNNLVTLPVTLSSFELEKRPNGVMLNWETSSETNNDRFEVERAEDNNPNFVKIGTVKGTGNSQNSKNYNFLDKNPSSGNNYYRIKQIDFDGKYTYSEIKQANYQPLNSILDIKIFPNPVSSIVQIFIPETNAKLLKLRIIDFTGRLQKQRDIKFDGNLISENIADLQNGIFIVEIKDANTGLLIGRTKLIKN